MYVTHNTPCATSTQHHCNTVSCQNPGQSREVRVPIGTLLKDALIQLSLQEHIQTKLAVNRAGRDWIEPEGEWLRQRPPAQVDFSWKTLAGGKTADGVWRSSCACSATRPSPWGAGRPPCAATPAASEPELRCPPASAPAAGERGQGRGQPPGSVCLIVKEGLDQ